MKHFKALDILLEQLEIKSQIVKDAIKKHMEITEMLMKDFGIAAQALEKIHEEEGKICEEFQTCKCISCASSHRSWEIANKALDTIK